MFDINNNKKNKLHKSPFRYDLENQFDNEFQEVATPDNSKELKSAYEDNNELKAYQAEWDLNIL